MAKRTQIEQELFKRKKVIRTIVRLKHSLVADDEINDTLDAHAKAFTKNVLQGELPPPLSVESILGDGVSDETPNP